MLQIFINNCNRGLNIFGKCIECTEQSPIKRAGNRLRFVITMLKKSTKISNISLENEVRQLNNKLTEVLAVAFLPTRASGEWIYLMDFPQCVV